MKPLRKRQKLGKYVIEGKIGEGGFATVYRARDTIEGIRVALKVPHQAYVTKESLALFQREVRLAAQLDHPHVLGLKYADFVDGRFVVVTAIGNETMESRMQRRMATSKAMQFAEQMIAAVACAHMQKIIHCDIKPDNFIVFPNDHLRLADFGIAIVAHRTVKGSGSGTVGYIAPEQALGKPSKRSDVFSLGLVLYRLFTGELPEWPFPWPGPGHKRLVARVHPDLVELVRRSTLVDSSQRYASAEQMLAAFRRVPASKRALGIQGNSGSRSATGRKRTSTSGSWRSVQFRQFQRQFRKSLETRYQCKGCEGPLAESMTNCPWCGKSHRKFASETSFAEQCPRCARGMKKDWKYCPWCHGSGFDVTTNRRLNDQRYLSKTNCQNPSCTRKVLFSFMKYCPWCNTKTRKLWRIKNDTGVVESRKCQRCGWGILPDFWKHCPWCSTRIKGAKS